MRNRSEVEQEPLVIDRSAAAEIPPQDAIREWAQGRRAFISSVMSELPAERQAAAAAARAVGVAPVMFEQFGGRDADPEDAYLSEVETSDIFLGILGRRYGKPLPSRFSATHAEYLHAEERGLRLAVWCMRANDREGHAESFLSEVRMFHVVPEFATPDDLRAQIEDRLKTIAAEDLAPWCKLSNIVFRATEVSDDGSRLRAVARVRSDEVAHALDVRRRAGRERPSLADNAVQARGGSAWRSAARSGMASAAPVREPTPFKSGDRGRCASLIGANHGCCCQHEAVRER